MGRTPGHPWIGESVPLDWANVISAAGDPPFDDDGEAMRFRVRVDSGSGYSTVVPGDSFIAGFFDSEVMLSGDDVVASFVLVCDGTGTLRLSGGTDPDWALDDPGDATVPMGTHVVSGPTVVVGDPFPAFDVDAYLAQAEETIVFVECLTGAITISQVKLRLWPSTGAVGGWADADGFTVEQMPETDLVSMQPSPATPTPTITAGNPADAFNQASLDIITGIGDEDNRQVSSATNPPQSLISASLHTFISVTRPLIPPSYDAWAEWSFGGSIVQQPDPFNVARINTPSHPGVYGVDFAWPPDEVPGDLGVQFPGDQPTTAWGEFTILASILDPGNVGSTWGKVMVTAIPDEARYDRSALVFPIYPPDYDVPPHGDTTDVIFPDSRTVLVSISHRAFYEPAEYLGDPTFSQGGIWRVGANFIGIAAERVESTITIPNYRYWSPGAVAAQPRILRQWPREDGYGGTPPIRGGNQMSRLASGNAHAYD